LPPPSAFLYADRSGSIWIASLGLATYMPEPEQHAAPAIPMIRALRIGGVPASMSDFGEATVPPLNLEPYQDNIQIDFASLDFRASEGLRYQYRLDDADREWSAPSAQRSVNYSKLAPGTYRFRVRAVNANGQISQPAEAVLAIAWPLHR